ncbi:ribonuclease E/G [Clostridium oryzae]|nr:ribonuclease E/G [Clostridium oryzae]
MFVEKQKEMLRIAVREDNVITDIIFEEQKNIAHQGEIYKGIVKSIIPGIKSAFVDIGMDQNAYLYLGGKYEKKGIKKGDELIVEVVKEETGNKGAKITTAFSIQGTYCVLLTDNCGISFSSKIKDQHLKDKVKRQIIKSDDIGIKIRTNAEFADMDRINTEIESLHAQYLKILGKSSYTMKPGILYSDGGALLHALRDFVDEDMKVIRANSEEDLETINEFLSEKKVEALKTALHKDEVGLFDTYGIEKQILFLRNSRVNLHCGGYIIIEKTEAMNVIDVNTGKNASDGFLEKTAYNTNMEAAAMVAKQVRLRNLSGIIVVDFVEMKDNEHRTNVEKQLRRCFSADKNSVTVFPLTELNLAQISRRRRGKMLNEYIEEDCTCCGTKGKILKFSYICSLIRNDIKKLVKNGMVENLFIEVNERYKQYIEERLEAFVESIDGSEKQIYLRYSNDIDPYRVKPLLFKNQLADLEDFKI